MKSNRQPNTTMPAKITCGKGLLACKSSAWSSVDLGAAPRPPRQLGL